MLTQEQTNTIVALVENERIHYSHLNYDLVDHICCDVENEMQQGYKFSDAYNKVQARIGYKGLKKIQDDTFYLIDKTYRKMKKTMKITGLIAPVLLGFGSLFKIMHWPGASILLVLGFFVLCFLFLPTSIYILYKETKSQKNVFTYVAGSLAAILYSLGVLFKVQHYPGASILITSGIITAVLVFMPALIASRLKATIEKPNRFATIIGLSALAILLLGFMFKIQHWPGANIILVLGNAFLFLFAIPYYTLATSREENFISGRFIFIIVASSWLVISLNLISAKSSSSIAKNYENIFEQVSCNIDALRISNQKAYKVIEDKDSLGFLELRNSTRSILAYIDDVKTSLLRMDNPKNPYVDELSASAIEFIRGPFERSIVHKYLVGETLNGKGYDMQEKLVSHLENIKDVFGGRIETDMIDQLSSVVNKENWVEGNLSNTMFFVVDYLTILQQKLLMMESDIQVQYRFKESQVALLNHENSKL